MGVLCLLAAFKYHLRERAVPASSAKAFNLFAVVGEVSRPGGYMPLGS